MTKLSIIIPVHELSNDKDKDFLKNALESLNKQTNQDFEVHLYLHKDVKFRLPNNLNFSLNRIKVDEKFSYTNAVNECVKKHVETDYFAVLEYDDIFHPYYVHEFYKYLDYYEESYDLYMGLLAEVNDVNQFMGLRNERGWVINDNQQLGVLDLESMKKDGRFHSFSLTGSIFSKKSFLEIGGLKEKFPIFFNQEYILRALNEGQEIYVIPKVMVNHTNGRDGSYYDQCSKEYDLESRKDYLHAVLKEYLFQEDREIKFLHNEQ